MKRTGRTLATVGIAVGLTVAQSLSAVAGPKFAKRHGGADNVLPPSSYLPTPVPGGWAGNGGKGAANNNVVQVPKGEKGHGESAVGAPPSITPPQSSPCAPLPPGGVPLMPTVPDRTGRGGQGSIRK